MNKMTIGLDVDGIIRDFVNRLRFVYKLYYPNHWISPIQHTYSLSKCFELDKQIYKFIYDEHPKEILDDANMYEGAKEFLLNLYLLMKKYDINLKIVTTQESNTAKQYTASWLQKHLIPELQETEIIYSNVKSKENINVLIDDAIHNLINCRINNITPICFNRDWNINDLTYRDNRVNSYDSLINLIEKIYNDNKKW